MSGDIGQRRRRIMGDAPRFADIVEASGEAIVSVDCEGLVETWNTAAEALFGLPAAEAIGAPFEALGTPPVSELLPATFDARWRRPAGAMIDVTLTVSTLPDADGQVIV